MWIVYGPYDIPFSVWPVLEVNGRSARLFCPLQNGPRFPDQLCPRNKNAKMNPKDFKAGTIMLAPQAYVSKSGRFEGTYVDQIRTLGELDITLILTPLELTIVYYSLKNRSLK